VASAPGMPETTSGSETYRSKAGAVAAEFDASRTRTAMPGDMPLAVGVPEMRPVAVSKVRPAGSWPVAREKVLVPTPPEAVN
jgi:hypothetical protein